MAFRSEPSVLDGKYLFEYDVGLWTFGTMQVLKDRKTGQLKTCKTVQKSSLRAPPAEVMARLMRLKELRHARLGSIEDILEDHSRIFIIQERALGGDVGDWVSRVQDEGHWLQEQTVAEYVRQALIAIAHCHSLRVGHRDLRPSNFTLTSKLPDAEVRLSDFGLAEALDPIDEVLTASPSPFTAPELAAGLGRTMPRAADMWSIGAIAHLLLVGQPPSQDSGAAWGAPGFLSRRDGEAWQERSELSEDFVKQLLTQAGNRPSAAKALQHPWIKAVVSLDSAHWDAGVAAGELKHRLVCYMLAVLLIPDRMEFRDLFQLRTAFGQADFDGDGFVSIAIGHRLLKDRGIPSPAAAAALNMTDVTRTDVIDVCGVAVAFLIGSDFLAAEEASGCNPAELTQRMIRRFFEVYGDSQRRGAEASSLTSRMSTATMRDMEQHAGVHYEEVLGCLPDSGMITADLLRSGLLESGARGTPLAPQEAEEFQREMQEGWVQPLNVDGINKFFSSVFQTCGIGDEKFRGYRGVLRGLGGQ
jgi:hypothetical protein|mmetsp:Transcript_74669/g.218780  ORF Transcript_74669/g.218780 Transcript_74669/m.218780 type:complete len:529 (-) Transcript_74669:304-1890(-)